jgi:hypothetical protein
MGLLRAVLRYCIAYLKLFYFQELLPLSDIYRRPCCVSATAPLRNGYVASANYFIMKFVTWCIGHGI